MSKLEEEAATFWHSFGSLGYATDVCKKSDDCGYSADIEDCVIPGLPTSQFKKFNS
jgi:hypothetical protein